MALNATDLRSILYDDEAIDSSPTPQTITQPTEEELDSIIDEYSGLYGTDSNYIKPLVKQETGGVITRNESSGASGIMQIMPRTEQAIAESLGEEWTPDDWKDARKNVRRGVKHLSDLYNKYGRWDLTYAAYKTGEGTVDKEVANAQAEGREPRVPNTYDRHVKEYTPDYVAKILSRIPGAEQLAASVQKSVTPGDAEALYWYQVFSGEKPTIDPSRFNPQANQKSEPIVFGEEEAIQIKPEKEPKVGLLTPLKSLVVGAKRIPAMSALSRGTGMQVPVQGAQQIEELDPEQQSLYKRGESVDAQLEEKTLKKSQLKGPDLLAWQFYNQKRTAQDYTTAMKPLGEAVAAWGEGLEESLPEWKKESEEAQRLVLDKNSWTADKMSDPKHAFTMLSALASSVSEQAPNFVMSAGSLLPGPARFVGAAVGVLGMIDLEAGGFIQNAKQNGITDPEILQQYSQLYAIPSGLVEFGSDIVVMAPAKVLGKITGKLAPAGVKKALSAAAKKMVIVKLFQAVGGVAGAAVIEGAEELTQGQIEKLVLRSALDAAAKKFPEKASEYAQRIKEIDMNLMSEGNVQGFILGALAGGVTRGAVDVGGRVANRLTQEKAPVGGGVETSIGPEISETLPKLGETQGTEFKVVDESGKELGGIEEVSKIIAGEPAEEVTTKAVLSDNVKSHLQKSFESQGIAVEDIPAKVSELEKSLSPEHIAALEELASDAVPEAGEVAAQPAEASAEVPVRDEGELDPLYKIPTRAAFDKRMQEEADADGQTAVALLDTHNQARLNDVIGHERTDSEVLKPIGEIEDRHIKKLREQGIDIQRYRTGGDERGVVARGIDAVELEKALRPMREEIDAYVNKTTVKDADGNEFALSELTHTKNDNIPSGAGYVNMGFADKSDIKKGSKNPIVDMLEAADKEAFARGKERNADTAQKLAIDKNVNFLYNKGTGKFVRESTVIGNLIEENRGKWKTDNYTELREKALAEIEKSGNYERYGQSKVEGKPATTGQMVEAEEGAIPEAVPGQAREQELLGGDTGATVSPEAKTETAEVTETGERPRVEEKIEKPGMGFTGILQKEYFPGHEIMFTSEFNKLSNADKYKALKAERKAIDERLKGASGKQASILNALYKRLERSMGPYSEARATKARQMGAQVDRLAEDNEQKTGLQKRLIVEIQDVLKAITPADINAILKSKYPEKQLNKAIAAIRKGNKDGEPAVEIRKEVGELLSAGVTPDQVVDLIQKEASRRAQEKEMGFDYGVSEEGIPLTKEGEPMFQRVAMQGDLFGGAEEVDAPEKRAAKAAEKAEIKRKQEEFKGGRVEGGDLPIFKGTGMFDEQQALFQRKGVQPEDKNLVALHNLSDRDIEKIDEMGGMPVPSIGITKKGQAYSGFGQITLIGDKELVDPSKAYNPVFTSDAYTQTVPAPTHRVNKRIGDKFMLEVNRVGYDNYDTGYGGDAEGAIKYGNRDKFTNAAERDMLIKATYLKENDVVVPTPRESANYASDFVELSKTKPVMDFFEKNPSFGSDIINDDVLAKELAKAIKQGVKITDPDNESRRAGLENLIDKKDGKPFFGPADRLHRAWYNDKNNITVVDRRALGNAIDAKVNELGEDKYAEWVEKKASEIFHSPYIDKKGKPDYTLENIVETIVRGRTAGAQKNMTFGINQAKAFGSKLFKTIDDIKAAQDRLVKYEDYDKAKDAVEKKFFEVTDQLTGYYRYARRGEISFERLNDASRSLADYYRKGKTTANMIAALRKNGFDSVPDYIAEEFQKVAQELLDSPVVYFEAKPQRAVSLSEFPGAVIPKGTSQRTKDILDKNGVKYVEYDMSIDGDRAEKVKKFSEEQGLTFQRTEAPEKGSTIKQVNEWLTDKGQKVQGKYEVVQSEADLPDNLSKAIKRKGAEGQIRAIFDPKTGKSYLIADMLPTRVTAERALAHEVFAHAGLRALLKGDVKSTFDDIYNSLSADDKRQVLRDYFTGEDGKSLFDEKNDIHRFTLVDEILASRGETAIDPTLWQKFVAAIRQLLRDMGFTGTWTENDIKNLLAGARKASETQGIVGGKTEAAAQRERQPAPDFYSPTLRAIEALKQEKGVVSQIQAMMARESKLSPTDKTYAEINDIKPDTKVTVYRATIPGGKLRYGDYITTDREQARFYSKDIVGQRGEKAAEIIAEKVNAGDIIQTINQKHIADEYLYRPAKQGQLKKAETDWMGLDQFLADNPKATKSDVLDFVREKQVRVDVVEKGWGAGVETFDRAEAVRAFENGETVFGFDESGDWHDGQIGWHKIEGLETPPDNINFESLNKYSQFKVSEKEPKTKFTQYNPFKESDDSPIGTNPREMNLVMPGGVAKYTESDIADVEVTGVGADVTFKDGRTVGVVEADEGIGLLHEDDMRKLAVKKANTESSPTQYRVPSLHQYGDRADQNRIAHVRTWDMDYQGDKTLAVAEMQSDWTAAARKQGVNKPLEWEPVGDRGSLRVEISEDDEIVLSRISDYDVSSGFGKTGQWKLVRSGTGTEELFNTEEEAKRQARIGFEGLSSAGVPPMPFFKNWDELAIKKSILTASADGYDRIVFANGTQTAGLYDLSKHYDAVRATLRPNGEYMISVKQKGENSYKNTESVSEIKLEETVGKDLAAKIISDGGGEYTGVDLKVGGEWAINLYDKRVPSILRDLIRKNKWNTQLEEIDIGAENGPNISLKITPEMAESISAEGQPMFKRVSELDNAEDIAPGIPPETLRDAFVRKIQDKFNRLSKLQEYKAGKNIAEEMDAYLAQEIWSGKAEDKLTLAEETLYNPLEKAVSKSGIAIEKVDEFLYAKHAPERNEHIANINEKFRNEYSSEGTLLSDKDFEYGSGMTNEEAAAIIQKAKDEGIYDKLEEISKIVYDITSRERAQRLEGELISPEEKKAWEKWEYYVPLKGTQEADKGRARVGNGFDIGGKESKRALGRKSKASNIVAHTIMQLNESIIRAEKNKVNQTFLKFVEANPDETLWQIDKVETKPVFDKNSGEVVYRDVAGYPLPDNVIRVKVGGEEHRITIKDRVLANAMKNLGTEKMGKAIQLMAAFNRYMSLINTALSIDFIPTNFARDLQTAMINMQGMGEFTGKEAMASSVKIAKSLPKALAGAWDGAHDAKTEWGKWYREYTQAGGKVAFLGLENVDDIQRRIVRNINMMKPGSKTAALRALKGVKDFVMSANEAVENSTRLATYVQMRKLGLSKAKSASIAKNITVNFNKKGELGTLINALYVFSNAGIQGTARLFKSLKNPRVQAIMGGIVASSLAMAQMSRLMGGKDDDDEDFYDKIPDWIKQNNYVILRPGVRERMKKENRNALTDADYFKFPVPYGYNVFWAFGQSMDKAIHHPDQAGRAAINVVASIADSFNPLGGSFAPRFKSIIQTFSPTFIRPVVDIAINENFFGAPIYKEEKGYGVQKAKAYQYFKRTPDWAKKAAALSNEITGGTMYQPGVGDISPDVMEYLVEYMTGGMGKSASQAIDFVSKASQKKEISSRNIPIVRRFVGEVEDYETEQRFWDNIEKIERVKADYKFIAKTEPKKATPFFKENSDVIYKEPKGTIRMLKEYRRLRDMYQAKGDRSREKKYEDLMLSEMKRFNKGMKGD